MPLDFVGIDFETANSKRASVCQIGITKVRDGRIVETASSYVTPPPGYGEFFPRNIEVHGITARMVRGAPGWTETLERLVRFTGDLPLVAHNAPFERSVVKAATEAVGAGLPRFNYYCSLKLARAVVPGEASYSLGPLLDSLGLAPFDHHDAGADAEASARLVLELARRRRISDVHRLFS